MLKQFLPKYSPSGSDPWLRILSRYRQITIRPYRPSNTRPFQWADMPTGQLRLQPVRVRGRS